MRKHTVVRFRYVWVVYVQREQAQIQTFVFKREDDADDFFFASMKEWIEESAFIPSDVKKAMLRDVAARRYSDVVHEWNEQVEGRVHVSGMWMTYQKMVTRRIPPRGVDVLDMRAQGKARLLESFKTPEEAQHFIDYYEGPTELGLFTE